ncbi:PP2C family protein-serine/threonine phosphatase [Streptomyces fildesensis]|uniref:PP2C family protein-serine/threonine phosphatase n=1 Tax=Streptomyces fildesensis TaxID=375757 RepID=A0ABW8C6H4_9ACTN
MRDSGTDGLSEALAAVEAAPPVESVDVIAAALRRQVGARSVSFLITDFTGGAVVRLGAVDDIDLDHSADPIPVSGTVYDEVIRTQQPHVERIGDGAWTRVIAPVTNRGDAIGLLELYLPHHPGPNTLEKIRRSAHALGYIVIANRPFTDLYQWGRRTAPLSLAAEIQHRLLPASLACEAAQFAVAGALEPAEFVGGDTFDYVIDRDHVQLSVTDAMGHDVDAALLATLLVGALRRARRQGADLTEQARQADQAMAEHSGGRYVTGQLLRISLHDGRTEFINAGHPWPLRLRAGKVEQLVPAIDMPFGFLAPHTYTVQHLDLRAGDRLVMLTDGMLERSAENLDLPALIASTHHLHPREAARVLIEHVVQAHDGQLQDDATVMCLDWYGTEDTRRHADHGADLTEASPSTHTEADTSPTA